MADTERNEDQKISRCLQEAFGYTDEQLLKQLDQANETLKDVTFDGAEDRIMKKIMARKAELEKETAAPELEIERKITLVEEKPESKKEKKIVRFGKKKVLATVALVAVIAGMLGGTAVGKRNLFLKKSEKTTEILLDNARNKTTDSELEEIYDEIKNALDMPVLKLGYYPEDMIIKDFEIYSDGAQIRFSYQNNLVYVTLSEKERTTSTSIESDRIEKKQTYNKWMNLNIEYRVSESADKNQECEALIIKNNYFYYISGDIQEDEFKRILDYLNFL